MSTPLYTQLVYRLRERGCGPELADRILANPNPSSDGGSLLEAVERDLTDLGMSVLWAVLNYRRQPSELWHLPASWVSFERERVRINVVPTAAVPVLGKLKAELPGDHKHVSGRSVFLPYPEVLTFYR